MVKDEFQARIPHGMFWVRFLALVNHMMVVIERLKCLYESCRSSKEWTVMAKPPVGPFTKKIKIDEVSVVHSPHLFYRARLVQVQKEFKVGPGTARPEPLGGWPEPILAQPVSFICTVNYLMSLIHFFS